ncbi:MAG: DUF805 domain-containing protein, partial [Pseudomonadota bacterium]
MDFPTAVKTGFRKAFNSSDRASRSEFWQFAPVALLPPGIFALLTEWAVIEFWSIWRVLVLMFLAMPLLTALARRLRDVGEDGEAAVWPFIPFAAAWMIWQAYYWGSYLVVNVFGGGGFFLILLLYIGVGIGLVALAAAMIVSFVVTITVIGHALLPSQPGPNKYGPNPNEVIQLDRESGGEGKSVLRGGGGGGG